ncbi:unnamed protein product, partial [Polarella glacialis]
ELPLFPLDLSDLEGAIGNFDDLDEFQASGWPPSCKLVAAGQLEQEMENEKMSGLLPEANLGTSSGSSGHQPAEDMIELEQELQGTAHAGSRSLLVNPGHERQELDEASAELLGRGSCSAPSSGSRRRIAGDGHRVAGTESVPVAAPPNGLGKEAAPARAGSRQVRHLMPRSPSQPHQRPGVSPVSIARKSSVAGLAATRSQPRSLSRSQASRDPSPNRSTKPMHLTSGGASSSSTAAPSREKPLRLGSSQAIERAAAAWAAEGATGGSPATSGFSKGGGHNTRGAATLAAYRLRARVSLNSLANLVSAGLIGKSRHPTTLSNGQALQLAWCLHPKDLTEGGFPSEVVGYPIYGHDFEHVTFVKATALGSLSVLASPGLVGVWWGPAMAAPSPSSQEASSADGRVLPQLMKDGEVLTRDHSFTGVIGRVLRDYPPGTQSLRELVQNADDARASTVSFFLTGSSQRALEEEHTYLHPAFKAYSGPAFYAYNDSIFSEADFNAIRSMGASSKKRDASKTGKFGLGFNAVYHFTDLPSFVTGRYLVVLDPHQRMLQGADREKAFARRWDFVKDQTLKQYGGHLAWFRGLASLDASLSEEYNGTLFRFPLPNESQAEHSDLSKLTWSIQQMGGIFEQFKDECERLLLFLKFVRKVDFWAEGDDGKLQQIYSAHLDTASDHGCEFLRTRSRFSEMLDMATKQGIRSAVQEHHASLCCVVMVDVLCAAGDEKECRTWLVASHVDTKEVLQFSDEKASEVPDSRFIPWMQLALPLRGSCEGFLFCFLQLPIGTGMPAHMNSFFELSSNRRDLWKGQDLAGPEAVKRDWNGLLLSHVAPRCLLAALEQLTILRIADTSISCANDYWQRCAPQLLRHFEKGFFELALAPDAPKLVETPAVIRPGEGAKEHIMQYGQELMTPKLLRSWLRSSNLVDPDAIMELLSYCLQDGARRTEAGRLAEDLEGCPLALMTDGQVQRFGAWDKSFLGDRFVCCSNEGDWDLAQHLPGNVVLRLSEGAAAASAMAEVLLQHPQVRPLDLEAAAELGASAKGSEWAKAFWNWHGLVSARNPAAKLPDPPGSQDHVFDHLQVLRAPSLGNGVGDTEALWPLRERRRALCCVDLACDLSRGLAACNVLLTKESVFPSVDGPDAVARAVAWAGHQDSIPRFAAAAPSEAAWRAVLEKLSRAQVPEATEAARLLPAFQRWGGGLGLADLELFPLTASKAMRNVLKMGVRELEPAEMAERALQQSTQLELVAQLLLENLGEALRGKAVLPVQGGGLLRPDECLLWDAETNFTHLSRRIDLAAGEGLLKHLRGRLLELGCRTDLDEQDALEVARQAEKTGDTELGQLLLQRLEKHPRFEELCASPALREVCWLPACGPRATVGAGSTLLFVAPSRRVWLPIAEPLVGLVQTLVRAEVGEQVLRALGVLGPETVDDAMLNQQLAALVASATSEGMGSSIAHFRVAAGAVYEHLCSAPTELDQWIWTEGGFHSQAAVSKDPRTEQLSPMLHRLRDEWRGLPVFSVVGEQLEPQQLFRALGSAPEAMHGVRVSAACLLASFISTGTGEAQSQAAALAALAEACGTTLRLPGKSGRLLPVQSVFVHDMRWRSEAPEGKEEVHGDVPEAVAQRFGVPRLSEVLADECRFSVGDGGDWLEITGQSEPLTRRLRNILKDYPWQSLVKEMLQNAEDAGAKTFRVLVDRRPRGCSSLLTPEMASCQGSCLWFYNDSVFEEKDFRALVSLGQGSKGGEAGKIGRHGLGFNSIFNVTDVPSVLSRQSVLFLDPHVKHLQKLGATAAQPGVRLNFSKKALHSAWPDQFAPYELQGCHLADGNFEGTLIRAPLRTCSSDISERCFGEKELQELLQLVRQEGHLWLLFLRGVCCLEVLDAASGEVLVCHRREESMPGRLRVLSKEAAEADWLTRDYDSQTQGEVSVAAPLRDSPMPEPGRVFSRLPLDMPSGLAAHVSALFRTSADRRTIVLDAAKDLGGWAEENRRLLAAICNCLGTLAARRAAAQKSTPLELFPQADQPSPAAKILRAGFYAEVAKRAARAEEGILYSVAGLPVHGPCVLLATIPIPPKALMALQAPVAAVHEEGFQGLSEAASTSFKLMTPSTLRAWLRQCPSHAVTHCDMELLSYCLQDGARRTEAGRLAEDLEGCPLALMTDGQVQHFGAWDKSFLGDRFVCCSNEGDWDLAQHLPGNVVLRLAEGAAAASAMAEVLLQHPQVRPLDLEAAAELGASAKGSEWAKAFWNWHGLVSAKNPAAKLPDPPGSQDHVFDHLQVLRAPSLGNGVGDTEALWPLRERRRALCCVDLACDLSRGLAACSVLLTKESVFPSVDGPDAVARAVAWAGHQDSIPRFAAAAPSEAAWRAVLEKLSRAQVPEATEAARLLPAFQRWGGGLGLADLELFPLTAFKAMRNVLKDLQLQVLDEQDGSVVELLRKMGVRELELAEVAERALQQSTQLELVAQLLLENLGEALRGEAVLPVQGGGLLRPDECLLWDAETNFTHLSRRIDLAAGEGLLKNLRGRLLELGCRTDLDEQDALEVARQAEKTGDTELGQLLLQRLEKHPRFEELCASPALREVCWLPACGPRATVGAGSTLLLVAPGRRVWLPIAEPLVGLVQTLVRAEVGEQVLRALGVLGPESVDDAMLHQQLAALVASASSEGMGSGIAHLRVAAGAVYEHLCSALTELDQWIWTEDGFHSPAAVSKDPRTEQLSPMLHRLRDEWRGLPVFSVVGEQLEPQQLFRALGSALEAMHGVRVAAACLLASLTGTSTGEAQSQAAALAALAEACGTTLRLPGKSGRLVPVQSVFIHDMRWRSEAPEGKEEVHGDVPEAVAQRFGVPRLSEVLADECRFSVGDGGDWLEVTGQSEPLTRRLRNILKDYPWQSLVKEMLQNAEDAGAKTFRMLVDRRPRGCSSLLTPEMASWQGPCLWFYNDSVFEEKDFAALVSLGQGSKGGEAGKIGRHGLGFNSIFNVTDLPSVLSRQSVLFLDPHVKHLQKLGATAAQPGVRLNFSKKALHSAWPDQFAPYELQGCHLADGNFEGTLIRAPLRTCSSDISERCFGEKELQELLQLVRQEGHLWLLFLRGVCCLEVLDAASGEVLVCHRREEPTPGRLRVLSKDAAEADWLTRDYDSQMQGEVSVAAPLRDSPMPEAGRVFSRLPLDMLSGLAAHVSALFWTSADRRTIVLDAAKDLGGWAEENRRLLAAICSCLGTLAARRAAEQKSTPLELFPQADQPSPTAKILRAGFYAEVAKRSAHAEAGILYSVAGVPVHGPCVLLATIPSPPTALIALQAPVAVVHEEGFQGLSEAASTSFKLMTPSTLRAWLRQCPSQAVTHCDMELLSYCLQDGARRTEAGRLAEDLEGCPLAIMTDGRVRCFGAWEEPFLEDRFVCCSNEGDWDIAQHLPGNVVLRLAEGAAAASAMAEVLLQHPQVRPLDVEAVAELGASATGSEWAKAFWNWHGFVSARNPAAKLPDPPGSQDHVFDHLQVLRAPSLGNGVGDTEALWPLRERRRALCCVDLACDLSRGLAACSVLLTKESVFPSVDGPDAVARAVAWAGHQDSIPRFAAAAPSEAAWRAVLEKLSRAQVLEATEAARLLPAFQRWGGGLGLADLELFPLTASKAMRNVLKDLQLQALDEQDGSVVELLRKMGVRELELAEVAERALQQTTQLELVAQLLLENLGEALRGEAVLPVQGGGLLRPDECLLWDAETNFAHLSRRIDLAAGEGLLKNLRGRLLELGCRTDLDEQDALEVARQAEKTGDTELGQLLLQRLEKHPRFEELCASPALREVCWLPACGPRATVGAGSTLLLVAPSRRVWLPIAEPLVGLVQTLVRAEVGEQVLRALSVLGPESVDDAMLHQQLAALVASASSEGMGSGIAHLRVAAGAVYEHLCSAPPELDEWIWTEAGFHSPAAVSKDPRTEQLSPMLHRLRDEWRGLPVFSVVGEQLEPQQLFRALGSALEAMHGVRVAAACLLASLTGTSTGEAQSQAAALAALAEACGTTLRLPGKSGRLVPVQSVFIHDMRWRSEAPEGKEEVHGDVPEAVAQRFGVPRLSEVLADECRFSVGDGGDWLEVTGQSEPLTRRLRNILKDYPWQSLVKEMLQNAEDAGAKTFRMLVDRRPRGCSSLLTSEMASWQGPCLWFYNDSVFEEKDFAALVSLGQGSKGGEAGKIGRHGLGFNSIFNVTDLPSVLSRRSVLFLDPHVKHLQKLGATAAQPGVRLNFSKKALHSAWPDQFAPYELQGCHLADGNFEGTLIRAPLRTCSSDISERCFGEKELQELLQLVRQEGHLWLLFLRGVCCLEVLDAACGEVLVCHRREEPTPGRLRVLSKDAADADWLTRDYDSQTQGEVSVAAPLRDSPMPEAGRVFSRLPLDMLSGLAAHVSALFWTSADRRTIVLDAAKDLGGWAEENRRLLAAICSCLGTLAARRAAEQKSTPLELFPQADQPSPTAKILRAGFYAEVAKRSAHAEAGILYSVAGVPVHGPCVLLATIPSPPTALIALQAPVAVVHEEGFQGLSEAASTSFKLMTPSTLRAWLRQYPSQAVTHCDMELLSYCLQDGARRTEAGRLAEDLEGCPLAIMTDGRVRCFGAWEEPFLEDRFVCCSNEGDWDIAQHLPGNVVLRLAEGAAAASAMAEVLLQHPQVRPLDVEAVAELGDSATGSERAKAFWNWHGFVSARNPAAKLPDPPGSQDHVFDNLQVLRAPSLDNGIGDTEALWPLRERRRALCCVDLACDLSRGLAACNVLLTKESVFPSVDGPDAVARAVAWAGHQDSIPRFVAAAASEAAWRAVLEKLSRAQVPEATEAARLLPAFQRWGGGLGLADLELFPLTASKAMRAVLKDLQLQALDEQDGSVVELLRKMGVRELELAEVAERALQQTTQLELVAQLLLENLGEALRGKAVLPVQGGGLLRPDECLLWDAETNFAHLSRRIDLAAGEGLLKNLRGRLLELGCRTDLDEQDALEVALRVQDSKELALGRSLLTRLQELEPVCQSALELRRLCWLPVVDHLAQRFLLAPNDDVWHETATCLVGRVRAIAHGKLSTLELLGVKLAKDVDDVVLIEQLDAIKQSGSWVSAAEVRPVYENLRAAPTSLHQWVWTADGFTDADDVSKDTRADQLKPFVHRLYDSWTDLPAFSGLSTFLSAEKLLQVLERADEQQRATDATLSGRLAGAMSNAIGLTGTSLSADGKLVKVADAALKMLHELLFEGLQAQREDLNWKSRLLIPSSDGKLRRIADLFVQDMRWATSTCVREAYCIHSDIPERHALDFGVRRCSELLLRQLISDPSGNGNASGPSEMGGMGPSDQMEHHIDELRKRVASEEHTLLGLVEVMLQLADSVNATKLGIVIDECQHGERSLLTPQMSMWQGPAMYLHFDACLTSNHWDDLKRLQGCWTRLFWFSDLPSVLSKGHVCFLDPFKGHLRAVCDSHVLSLASQGLDQLWPDQFAPFGKAIKDKGSLFSGQFSGTVIRLPLKHLSPDPTGLKNAQNVLRAQVPAIGEHWQAWLLFTRSIRTLEVSVSLGEHGPQPLLEVGLSVKGMPQNATAKNRVELRTVRRVSEPQVEHPSRSWLVAWTSEDGLCKSDVAVAVPHKLHAVEPHPCVGRTAPIEQQSPVALQGGHIHGLGADELAQLTAAGMRQTLTQVDVRLHALASVLVDIVLQIWEADHVLPASLVPSQIAGTSAKSPLARLFSVALLERFRVEGRKLQECCYAPRPDLLTVPFRIWLASELQILVLPDSLKHLLAGGADLAIQEAQVDSVLNGFGHLPGMHASAACKWLFTAFPDVAGRFTPELRSSVRLLQREDKTFGNFSGWTWLCPKGLRPLIKDKKPSNVILNSLVAESHFDKRIGVLNPAKIDDIARSVDDVRAEMFWTAIKDGLYAGQEHQISLLESKIHVRVKVHASQPTSDPLEKYGFLTDTTTAIEALLAIGCRQALDAVPEPYAGSRPAHVAQHIAQLRNRALLRVDAASADCKDRLCKAYLNPTCGSEADGRQVFLELPIVRHGIRFVALKDCRFVNSDGFADICQKIGLLVRSTSDPLFLASRDLLRHLEDRPGSLLRRCQDEIRLKSTALETVQQLLLAGVTAAGADEEQVRLVLESQILPGNRAAVDLWSPSDPLAKMLGAFDSSLSMLTRELHAHPVAKRFLKSTRNAKSLMALLEAKPPESNVAQAQRSHFTTKLLELLEGMSKEHIDGIKQLGFAALPVLFLDGAWHQSSKVYLNKFWHLLNKCSVPVLSIPVGNHLELMFGEEPCAELVAKQLIALCSGRHHERSPFIAAYEFLNDRLSEDSPAAEELKNLRCILDDGGVLYLPRHFSLRLLVSLGPLHPVAADVKRFRSLLLKLGVRDTASEVPLPEPLRPKKLLEQLRDDDRFADLVMRSRDGHANGHRAVWCTVCPNLEAKLVWDGHMWSTSTPLRCSSQCLDVVRNFVYTGSLDQESVMKLNISDQQELHGVATYLGMLYVQEWMKQFLHGATPEANEDVDHNRCEPPHCSREKMPDQGWRVIPVHHDDPVFKSLGRALVPEDPMTLGRGRDCHSWPPYSQLILQRAWRLEHRGLWRKFAAERSSLKELQATRLSKMPRVKVRQNLVQATQDLPLSVLKEVNEVHLLHGTKPETVLNILNDGLNERYSGGIFGSGSYLAEAMAGHDIISLRLAGFSILVVWSMSPIRQIGPKGHDHPVNQAKSDQYTTVDRTSSVDSTFQDLQKCLYGRDASRPNEVFYIVVCRALLGWFVRTSDGTTSLDHNGLGIWATRDKRELSSVPKLKPPVTFHSLQAETGGIVARHREYILTHSERIYPEYLIAYSRQ